MKAISLHEPYASLVMWGWKTIETRTHRRFSGLKGQLIAIHATKNKSFLRSDILQEVMSFMNQGKKREFLEELNKKDHFENTFGKLLGTVRVVSYRILDARDSDKAMIDCGIITRFGLFLDNPRWFKNQKPYKGHQGIFHVDLDTVKELGYE